MRSIPHRKILGSCGDLTPAARCKRWAPANLGTARGRKGKGAGGGGIEAPNTLQSISTVRIIDLLCEGPIGGLANGAHSIYFNGVPLMAASGAYNFKGVTWQLMTGLPDQAALPGFPAVESTFPYGVPVTHSIPQYHEVTNTEVTRCTVTMNFPALFDTDTSNGNINPYSVRFQIAVQPNGGSYQTVIDQTITGKCTSPYEQSFTFQMPGEGPWVVEITRVTVDSNTVNVQDGTVFAAIDEIVDQAISYSDSVVIGLTFNAQLFGSTIPTRTYDISALIIQVPENYDPVALTYATTGPGTSGGTWDGFSMKPASTANPAWIVFDLLQNNRYGMGLPAAAMEATKWDLYQIAQYCDEQIPDLVTGTGTVPRYTCNVCISSRDDAYRILQAFTSIFRGMSYWGSGTVRITADMPGPVVKLVNQTDVIGGNFAYAGTALKARHSMAIASYIDPINQWQPSPVVYQDQTQINSLYGQNIAQIAAFGATDKNQAYLACKWLIDSEAHQYDTVTYEAGLDHLDVMPGDIVEIADPAYMGLRLGGRILSALGGSTTSVTVDYPVITNVSALPATGTPLQLVYWVGNGDYYWDDATGAWVEVFINTYLLSVEVPGVGTGVVENQPVSEMIDNGDGTTTIVIGALPTPPPAGALWRLSNSQVEPRQFRLIGITEPERGKVSVTALAHDPTKYARIEYNIILTDVPYSVLPDVYGDDIGPPTAVTVSDGFVGEGTTTVLRTVVSWTPSTDARVLTYNVEIGGDTGYVNQLAHLPGPSVDVDNIPVGNYVFGVQGVSAEGRTSPWALSQQLLINGQPIAPPAPLGLTAVGGTRTVSVYWDAVVCQNLYFYEVWRASDTALADATFLAQASGTSYTDSQSTVLQPNTTWYYFVRAVTTTLTNGPFAGPAGATTTNLLVADLPLAIQQVAAYAQGLLGAAPQLYTTLPVPPPSGVTLGVLESDGKLYAWNATTQAWAVSGVIIGADGKIVAGSIEAGAIGAQEIAAGSIHAEQLASDTLLTNQAQIGYAVVGTLQLINDSVTSFSTTSRTDSYTGNSGGDATGGYTNVISFTLSVPEARQAIIFYTGTQSYPASGSGTSFNYNFLLNGTQIFADGHEAETTAPNYQVPCTLQEGNNTVEVDWAANSGVKLASRSLTVFGRIV